MPGAADGVVAARGAGVSSQAPHRGYRTHDALRSGTGGRSRSASEGGEGDGLAEVIPDPGHEDADASLEKRERLEGLAEGFATLSERDRLILTLSYYERLTLHQIGEVLHITESRVSQLHARAMQRLRAALEPERPARATGQPARSVPVITALTPRVPNASRPVLPFARPVMAKASLPPAAGHAGATVLSYTSISRADRSKSASLNGFASQRQPVSSRNRSASVLTTSPVTKMTRRASDGLAAAMAR